MVNVYRNIGADFHTGGVFASAQSTIRAFGSDYPVARGTLDAGYEITPSEGQGRARISLEVVLGDGHLALDANLYVYAILKGEIDLFFWSRKIDEKWNKTLASFHLADERIRIVSIGG